MGNPAEPISATSRGLRSFVLLIFLFSLIGTFVDLLLIDHYEDLWMFIPIGVMGLALISLFVHAILPGVASVRGFQIIMMLLILSGGLGMYFHHESKEEFRLEVQPDLAGFELFWESLRGTTPPSLAPAAMIQIGLLGLAWTWRHPALNNRRIENLHGEESHES